MAGRHYSIKGFREFFLSEHRRQGEPGNAEPPKFQEFHMVVAALIAAVTFQACVNPPGGVWQEDKELNGTIREAGRAVYASDETAFYVFLAFNTLAFSTSMYLLIYLTLGYPFFSKVVVAMASMGITYGASIFAITPSNFMAGESLLSIAAVPIIVRAAILIYKYVMSEKNKQERWVVKSDDAIMIFSGLVLNISVFSVGMSICKREKERHNVAAVETANDFGRDGLWSRISMCHW